MVANYRTFSPDGYRATWATWDGEHRESWSLRWDNEAWTAEGHVGRENVEYVLRISPLWDVRQLLLFRDLDDPDLWLATDGHARWGEMNGAHRTELDGVRYLDVSCTPFTNSLPIRQLPLQVSEAAEIPVARVDVDTLAVMRETHRYTRLADRRWRYENLATGTEVELLVDEYGLVNDYPGHFRRVA